MFNPLQKLRALFPEAPLQVGTVVAVDNGVCTIQLPDGGYTQARGTYTVGARVFFRDGVTEGNAPSLPYVSFDV